MSDISILRKRGRPRNDEPNKSISPKKQRSTIANNKGFSEIDFQNWLIDCSMIVLSDWELRTFKYKHYIEVTRWKDGVTSMPFAFVDARNGNIHCPALMHGDPHEYVRGNISDSLTRLTDITTHGVLAHWPWQPTNPEYKHLDKLDFSAINVEDKESDSDERFGDGPQDLPKEPTC